MGIMKFFESKSLNHVTRIRYRLSDALEIIEKNAPKDVKNKCNRYMKEIDIIHNKTYAFFIISVFLYMVLYVSIVSVITKNIFFVEGAMKLLSWLAGLAGSFIIVAILFMISNFNKVNISEALTLSGYITAYGAKYDDGTFDKTSNKLSKNKIDKVKNKVKNKILKVKDKVKDKVVSKSKEEKREDNL